MAPDLAVAGLNYFKLDDGGGYLVIPEEARKFVRVLKPTMRPTRATPTVDSFPGDAGLPL